MVYILGKPGTPQPLSGQSRWRQSLPAKFPGLNGCGICSVQGRDSSSGRRPAARSGRGAGPALPRPRPRRGAGPEGLSRPAAAGGTRRHAALPLGGRKRGPTPTSGSGTAETLPVMQPRAPPLPRRDGGETALRARDQQRRLRRRHLEWGREAAVTISHRVPARGRVWRSGSPGSGRFAPTGTAGRAERKRGCPLMGRGGAMIDPSCPQTKRGVTPSPGAALREETSGPLRRSLG